MASLCPACLGDAWLQFLHLISWKLIRMISAAGGQNHSEDRSRLGQPGAVDDGGVAFRIALKTPS